MIDRYTLAITLARNAHNGQCRKYTGEPYITHPFAVAGLVASVTVDEDMIIAALLHDTIEDTAITSDIIERNLGTRVCDMVLDVTDVSKKSDGKRSVRKAIDREHNAKASPEAKTIKLADIIDNIKCIQGHDENFARKYMAEKRELLQVLTEGDEYLFRVATNILDDYCCKKV